jgi:hypothetical protein
MQGRWAHDLDVPLSGLAQWSFCLIPIAALLPVVLPRRFSLRARILCCEALICGVVMFPIALFSLGTREVVFVGEPPSNLTAELCAEVGFPVIVIQDGKSHIYLRRDHDPNLVRGALRHRHINQNG